MELSFGQWEGLTWAEIKARDPAGAVARRADKWGFVPPGGESYALLAERVNGCLAGLGGDALIVAHGRVARALMVLLAGAPPKIAAAAPIPQGVAMIFEKGTCREIG